MRLVLSLFAILAACQSAPSEPVQDQAPVGQDVPAVPTADRMAELANVPDGEVAEAMPAGPEVLARGRFRGASGHDVAGQAVLYRLDDGSHLVRLEGLESDNGPDLKVWLVPLDHRRRGARNGASLGAAQERARQPELPRPRRRRPRGLRGASRSGASGSRSTSAPRPWLSSRRLLRT